MRLPGALLLSAGLLLACATRSGAATSGDSATVAREPVTWSTLVAGQAKIKFYGFIRFDMIYDDSRPNSFESPLYIFSEDPALGPENQQNFTMHPRLTRFGFDLKGRPLSRVGGAAVAGKLEMDFQNGGSESRQIIRIRHAYLQLAWSSTTLLVGQTWDVIAPLIPTANNDALMWDAGNIGDRRPQIRLTWNHGAGAGAFTLAGMAGLTGAVDSQDLDGNGVRDGEAAALPNFQARAEYAAPLGADRWSIGLSGLDGSQKTATLVAGKTEFHPRAVAVDMRLPLRPWLTFQGEGWSGRNLSDFRGGVAQSVNTDPTSVAFGREIESHGGWIEAGVRVARGWTLTPGYTVDDPDDGNLPAGTTQADAGRTRNEAWYLNTRWQPESELLVGLDLLGWKTDYKAFASGDDNRLDLYVQYSF